MSSQHGRFSGDWKALFRPLRIHRLFYPQGSLPHLIAILKDILPSSPHSDQQGSLGRLAPQGPVPHVEYGASRGGSLAVAVFSGSRQTSRPTNVHAWPDVIVATYSRLLSSTAPGRLFPSLQPVPGPCQPSPDSSYASLLTGGLVRRCCGVSSDPSSSPTCWLPGLHATSTPGRVPVTLSCPSPRHARSPSLGRTAHTWGDGLRSVGVSETQTHRGQRVSETHTGQEGILGAQIREWGLAQSLSELSLAGVLAQGSCAISGLGCHERGLQSNERVPDVLHSMVGVGRTSGGGDRSRVPSPAFHSPRTPCSLGPVRSQATWQ